MFVLFVLFLMFCALLMLYISLPVPIFQCSAFCINFLARNLRFFLNIQQSWEPFSLVLRIR